jgi:hypothetical protein
MNPDALGQFLMLVFVPFIPLIAGAVIAMIGSLLVIVMFRSFLPSDE